MFFRACVQSYSDSDEATMERVASVGCPVVTVTHDHVASPPCPPRNAQGAFALHCAASLALVLSRDRDRNKNNVGASWGGDVNVTVNVTNDGQGFVAECEPSKRAWWGEGRRRRGRGWARQSREQSQRRPGGRSWFTLNAEWPWWWWWSWRRWWSWRNHVGGRPRQRHSRTVPCSRGRRAGLACETRLGWRGDAQAGGGDSRQEEAQTVELGLAV